MDNYGSLDDGDYAEIGAIGSILRFQNEAEVDSAVAQTLNAGGVSALQDALAGDQFQIRLQFNEEHTDNDGEADMLRLTSSLVVTYED